MMITSPGPFTFQKRPKVKTTPRSYSRKMRIAEVKNTTTRKIITSPNQLEYKIILFSPFVSCAALLYCIKHALKMPSNPRLCLRSVKQHQLPIDTGTGLFQNLRCSKKILGQHRKKFRRVGGSIRIDKGRFS